VLTLRVVFANRNLRRLELAFIAAIAADWAFTVGLGVFAYQEGGATAVGAMGVARMLPAAVGTPLVSIVADRIERERVLVAVAAGATAAMAAAAATFYLDWSIVAVFVLAGLQGLAAAVFRPTLSALLPSITTTPEELIAANGVSSTIEGLGTLLGPLMAGVVVAAADAGAVFILAAAVNLGAMWLVALIHVEGRVRTAMANTASDFLAGFRVLVRESSPRLIVALVGAQSCVRGALNVLIVVVSFQLLDAGGEWVGFLSAALGAGGFVGGAVALRLAGTRLAAPFALGLVLWGIPLALLAIVPAQVPALALLAIIGLGNAIEDVAGVTLIQRFASDRLLARLFGVLFGVGMSGTAIGSIVAPSLVGALGPRGALLVTGALLPALVVLFWRRLRAIDEAAAGPVRELALLERIPLFTPLSVAAKEYVASSLVPVAAAPGTELIREGDVGDRFYIIASGRAEMTTDGRVLAVRGPGEYFGEIALLRGSPRTATVVARDDMQLYSLDRASFLTAVTGHPLSLAAGEGIVRERLATLGP
jgi:MFS family permease